MTTEATTMIAESVLAAIRQRDTALHVMCDNNPDAINTSIMAGLTAAIGTILGSVASTEKEYTVGVMLLLKLLHEDRDTYLRFGKDRREGR